MAHELSDETKKHLEKIAAFRACSGSQAWRPRVKFTIIIRDSRGTHQPFPFDAETPEGAATGIAADGDWEWWETIQIEVWRGARTWVFEIDTAPDYEPRSVGQYDASDRDAVVRELELASKIAADIFPRGNLAWALRGVGDFLEAGKASSADAVRGAQVLMRMANL